MRLIATCLVFLFSASVALPASAVYRLQQEESVVGFSWFLGKDEVKGTMPVSHADLMLDFDDVANSRIKVALDLAHAEAGFPFATQAMKGPKVLWADKFPEIVFESTSVKRSGEGAEVAGKLTVRGVTLPVVFRAELYRQRGTVEGDRSRMSVVVRGSLSRAAFGADGWSDMAGDEVRLTILARMELAR